MLSVQQIDLLRTFQYCSWSLISSTLGKPFRKTITAVVPQRILLADNSQLLSSALSTHHWPPSACHAHSHLPHPPTITANTLPALTVSSVVDNVGRLNLRESDNDIRRCLFPNTEDSDRDNRTLANSRTIVNHTTRHAMYVSKLKQHCLKQ